MGGVDIVASRQLFHQFMWPVPQALAGDHDECAGRRLDHVTSPNIGGTVAADNLPIDAPGQDPAGSLLPAYCAAENADHTSLAIRCAPEIGDGLELGVNRENRLLAQHRRRSVGVPTYDAIAI